MRTGKKIFNDPVYGFVTVPYGLLFDLIEHPYFQRLRRIKQLSLTHLVYPGALHTRFHHALGALHLMQQAIDVLKSKGTVITKEEETAVCAAILLHDIGHGPFSHTLEHTLINVSHETLSVHFMEAMNEVFDHRLDLALAIFKNEYPKRFLHQLVSGQLDMDRLDYLNRDSFFTGVSEGVIGYDRIIKMLDVYQDDLVVEEKGIYSIEKFLIARRLMYWQVYLHKTVLAAELMLIKVIERAKELTMGGIRLPVSDHLHFLLSGGGENDTGELLYHFALLDDYDVVAGLKNFCEHEDTLLAFLSAGIIKRNLFKIILRNTPFSGDELEEIRHKAADCDQLPSVHPDYLIITGKEHNTVYTIAKEEIKILFKSGEVFPMSKSTDYNIQAAAAHKYYLCFPREIG